GGATQAPPAAPTAVATADNNTEIAALPPSPPPPAAAARPEPKPSAVESPSATVGPAPVTAAPPIERGPYFAWPLKGRIVSPFGPKKGGEHNDGINIAAARGAPVRAADDGVVTYAGNELRGFGNLVLIRHDDGWTTAYAHNEQLLVKRGDAVKRGQVIAKAGSSGSVATPQLHFEIRRGRRAVDPAAYLTAEGPSVSLNRVAGRDAPPSPE
ncbi:MAG: M23 family metallopeptidase, partial [Alphaproteobacteria bacterium]